MLETSSLKSLARPMLVEARLESHPLPEVAAETRAQLRGLFAGGVLADRRVAVGVGSRGIDQLAKVVKAAIETLRELGALPFLFPAMGSHGGGTSEGQRMMLASLGVTEEAMGVPIEAAMETVELGRAASGTRLLASRPALDADAMLFINRVKPHTDFVSERVGSGLRKMLVIGLGKIEGAFEYHRAALRQGYEAMITEVSAEIVQRIPHLYGLALVEDGYHQLARIEAMPGGAFAEREPALFRLADEWMPRLPFRNIDVLIVDEIGKNISGSGMDPNVTGRDIHGKPQPNRRTDVRSIFVRGLTPESHGNAIGLGYADIVSSRLVEAMDKQITYTNSLSSMTPASSRIPMHFATDAECLAAAVRMSGETPDAARLVHIRNTLAVNRFLACEHYAEEIAKRSDLTVLERYDAWEFAEDNTLARLPR